MLKETNENPRQHVLEEAKTWWDKLTDIEKTLQMKKSRFIDSDESTSVGRSRLMGWDQVDLEEYRQRILGKSKE